MEDRTTLSYIVPSECVAECVQRASRWFEAKSGAKTFDISKGDVPAHLRPELARQKKFVRLLVVFADKTKDLATQFKREGNDPLLVALACQRHQQVVEVDVFHMNR